MTNFAKLIGIYFVAMYLPLPFVILLDLPWPAVLALAFAWGYWCAPDYIGHFKKKLLKKAKTDE